jgi:hypothetical protein
MAKLPEFFEFAKPDGTIDRVYVTHKHNSIQFTLSDLEGKYLEAIKRIEKLKEDVEIKNKHLEIIKESNRKYIQAFEDQVEEIAILKTYKEKLIEIEDILTFEDYGALETLEKIHNLINR